MSAVAPSRATGRPSAGLLVFLVGLTAIRLAVAGLTGLVDDEAYYRLWSLAPAFGYLDHAPMIAWAIAASRAIVGDGSLGVRLFAPLATLVGSLMLWRAVALLDRPATATRAVVFFNAMILIGAGSVLATPDGPSVFFWGATLWLLAELQASGDRRLWLAIGLAAGLGLLSKYSVLFLGLGIGVWLISTRESRRWLTAPQLWVGGAIAALLFAPVVHWNATHEWVSFVKQFGRTVPGEFRPEKLGELIGVQLLLIGLPMVPFVALGIARALRGLRAGAAAEWLPLATGVPFLAYLMLHSLHHSVEGNWPAPLYPAFAWMAARGVDDLDRLSAASADRMRRVLDWVAPVGYGLVALVYLHVLVPAIVLPARMDPTAQMKGWPAFGVAVERLAAAKGAPLVGAANYTLAGQLAMRLGAEVVAPFDERERWRDLPLADPWTAEGPILLVGREGRELPVEVTRHWRRVEALAPLERRAGDRVVEAHTVHLLADPVR